MREVRKKQKNFYKFLKSLVIFSVVFIFVYIGAQPYVKSFNETLAVAVNYACDILVIINLVVIFLYYSKYGKVESFLKDIENELEKRLVLQAVSKLNQRECLIMELRFGLNGRKEHTQKQVADKLGISQSYISRLEKKIIRRLKHELEKAV